MFVVTAATASVGAKPLGVTIPGNLVRGVYRNDFAVRMLKTRVASEIEPPLRFYVTATPDKSGNTYLLESECGLRCLRQCGAEQEGSGNQYNLGKDRRSDDEEVTFG